MRPESMRRWAERYARIALGAAFLSAVASRFGLWRGRPIAVSFAGFVRYTGDVIAFAPRPMIPALAVTATAAELSLGIALVLGVRPRATAIASAVLLALFATSMAISLGPQAPLDYSVYSASAAAALLAAYATTNSRTS